jgi:hypothetical protein
VTTQCRPIGRAVVLSLMHCASKQRDMLLSLCQAQSQLWPATAVLQMQAHLCCGLPLPNGTSVLYCRKWMGPKSKEYQGVASLAGAGILKRLWCDTPHSPPARHFAFKMLLGGSNRSGAPHAQHAVEVSKQQTAGCQAHRHCP